MLRTQTFYNILLPSTIHEYDRNLSNPRVSYTQVSDRLCLLGQIRDGRKGFVNVEDEVRSVTDSTPENIGQVHEFIDVCDS